MTVQQFANLLGIVLGFVAGLYFCLGSAEMKAAQIKDLAGTHWGDNPHISKFFVALKSDYLCGGIALCLAFVLQLLSAVPGQLPQTVIFSKSGSGAFVAAASAALIGGLLWLYRRWVIKRLGTELARSES